MSKTVYKLSNGVEVVGTDSNTSTGYIGASFSPAWTNDLSRPFIANASITESVRSQLRVKGRSNWHGGHYADAREAAYVSALFKEDPVTTDNDLHNHNIVIPSEVYSLPEGLKLADAVDLIQAHRKAKAKALKKTRTVVVKLDPTITPARGNLYRFFDRKDIVPLAQNLGGAEVFQASLEGKTVAQFAEEAGLALDLE